MNDIFISYAHIDDKPLTEGQRGWVSQFHRVLELRLAQLMGEDATIWRDLKLSGNDVFDEAIIHQLPQARALVSVVSPRYVKSEWCRREIQEFWKAAEQSGGVRVNDKSRIFKVIKTPVAAEEIPQPLNRLFQSLLGFEFYSIDPETGRLREYYEEFGPDAKRSYLEKVYDLAHEIYQLLKVFRSDKLPGASPSATGKVVYLAETTSDLQTERDRLKRELLERGHKVLPEYPLPLEISEATNVVRRDLERSQVAIHLVGEPYGIIPEGSDCSLVELQTRLATARCGSSEFCRFIWSPPGAKALDARQAAYLKSLEEDGLGMVSTELLAGTLEQLKSLVVKKLAVRVSAPIVEPVSPENFRQVYLIHDAKDETAIAPLEDFLFEQGLEVKVSHLEAGEAALFQAHKENLTHSDAVLIYYGHASSQWVDMKLMELLKAPGYGRQKPWGAKAVYVAPPPHARKVRFRTHIAEVIQGGDQFETAQLEAFVKTVQTNPPPGRDLRQDYLRQNYYYQKICRLHTIFDCSLLPTKNSMLSITR